MIHSFLVLSQDFQGISSDVYRSSSVLYLKAGCMHCAAIYIPGYYCLFVIQPQSEQLQLHSPESKRGSRNMMSCMKPQCFDRYMTDKRLYHNEERTMNTLNTITSIAAPAAPHVGDPLQSVVSS